MPPPDPSPLTFHQLNPPTLTPSPASTGPHEIHPPLHSHDLFISIHALDRAVMHLADNTQRL
jgi:hypothetical protein